MMNEIKVTSVEEMESLQCEYNLEDCGTSGKYPGWHWYQNDEANNGEGIVVYFKNEEE